MRAAGARYASMIEIVTALMAQHAKISSKKIRPQKQPGFLKLKRIYA
jgi:hypothetical protein